MDERELLTLFIKNGFLVEPEILKILSELNNPELANVIIERLKLRPATKIITKKTIEQNREEFKEIFLSLPEKTKTELENIKIKLGLEIEISKESLKSKKSLLSDINKIQEIDNYPPKIVIDPKKITGKKNVSVEDFTNLFKDRFAELKNILQNKPELENLASVNKISSGKKLSTIGIVLDKRITKNKNLLFEIEDLTGRMKILVNNNKTDIYKKAEEISLDSVIGVVGSRTKDFFFVNDIIFPEAMLSERKKAPVEEYALFIGDIHYGSKLFMKENFLKFIDFLNGKGDNKDFEKINYLFILGDMVAGIGVYPNQELDLEILDLEDQFRGFAELIGRIRRNLSIIISPGNHDGVRVSEPQPPLDEKYSWPLYNMRNVILTGNPSYVNIGQKEKFPGVDVLIYHGFSYPYYATTVPSLINTGGLNAPEKVMTYLLKNRHLAPTHSSTQLFPFQKDELVIKKVPDIFVSGHTHKCAASFYNNILIISTSSWEKETEYQRRKGNQADFCKVPMVNLKTGAVKILDFE